MQRLFPRRNVLKAGAAVLTTSPLLAATFVAPSRAAVDVSSPPDSANASIVAGAPATESVQEIPNTSDLLTGSEIPNVVIRYVHTAGDDANDGLSWLKPKATIAGAIKSLPATGNGRQAHNYGRIVLGRGTFVETNTPLELNAGLEIVGAGSGPNGTIIQLGDNRNTHLFAKTAAFTDYAHHVLFEDLTLDGNKANNKGSYDCLQILNGGFNCTLRRVKVQNAARYGVLLEQNAVNVTMYDFTASGCTAGALYLDMATASNNANLSIFGAQIDDCGVYPITLNSAQDGDACAVTIVGAKFEGHTTGVHDGAIRVIAAGGANPLNVTLIGVTAYRVGPNATSVVYESSGTTEGARFMLQQVAGSGYLTAFKSDYLGVTAPSAHLTHWQVPGEIYLAQRYGAAGYALIKAAVDSPESSVSGPAGSFFYNLKGGVGTAAYMKITGTGNTGWCPVNGKKLIATIGTRQTAVAHGLGFTPRILGLVPHGDARVWQTSVPDGTNVYLTASTSVSCDIIVG